MGTQYCRKYSNGGMEVQIYDSSILDCKVDAIVNAANADLSHDGGVAKVISDRAGQMLQDECKDFIRQHGKLDVTKNFVTTAGQLKNCSRVIHVVGPMWSLYRNKDNCAKDLYLTVIQALQTAENTKMRTVAMPTISSGIFGVPKEICAEMYVKAIWDYAQERPLSSVKSIHIVDVTDDLLKLIVKIIEARKSNPSLLKYGTAPFNLRWNFGNKGQETSFWCHFSSGLATSNQSVSTGARPKHVTGIPSTSSSRKVGSNTAPSSTFTLTLNTPQPGTGDYTISVSTGFLTDVINVDAIVCSVGMLLEGGPLFQAIADAAGPRYRNAVDAKRKQIKNAKPGDVFVTEGGTLGKYVLHAVMASRQMTTVTEVQQWLTAVTESILKESSTWGFKAIAMPLLGVGGLTRETDIQQCANTFVDAVMDTFTRGRNKHPCVQKLMVVNKDPSHTKVVSKVITSKSSSYRRSLSNYDHGSPGFTDHQNASTPTGYNPDESHLRHRDMSAKRNISTGDHQRKMVPSPRQPVAAKSMVWNRSPSNCDRGSPGFTSHHNTTTQMRYNSDQSHLRHSDSSAKRIISTGDHQRKMVPSPRQPVAAKSMVWNRSPLNCNRGSPGFTDHQNTPTQTGYNSDQSHLRHGYTSAKNSISKGDHQRKIVTSPRQPVVAKPLVWNTKSSSLNKYRQRDRKRTNYSCGNRSSSFKNSDYKTRVVKDNGDYVEVDDVLDVGDDVSDDYDSDSDGKEFKDGKSTGNLKIFDGSASIMEPNRSISALVGSRENEVYQKVCSDKVYSETSAGEDDGLEKPRANGSSSTIASASFIKRSKRPTTPTAVSDTDDEKDRPPCDSNTRNLSQCEQRSEHKDREDDTCVICIDSPTKPRRLSCGHEFCEECIEAAFKHKPACPICGKIFGDVTGNQPPGNMQVHFYNRCETSLPGYEKYGTIMIDYTFRGGRQGSNHPHPGQFYKGGRRKAYLPDNREGRKVLDLLKIAWDRRLIFTIGDSRSSGKEDVVTWNDIHHKTNIHGGPQKFGYPDPDYLFRVQEELEAKGITEDLLS